MARKNRISLEEVCPQNTIQNLLKPLSEALSNLRMPSQKRRKKEGRKLKREIERSEKMPIVFLEDDESIVTFPQDIQLFGLSCAAIMVADKALKSSGFRLGKKESTYWCLGDSIKKGVFWSEAVIAAGNYVRHGEEWEKYLTTIDSIDKDGKKCKQIFGSEVANQAIADFKRRDPVFAKSAEILQKLGISEYMIFYHHDFAIIEVVNILGLDDNQKFVQFFETWLKAAVSLRNDRVN